MATGRKKPIEEIEEMAAELFGCTWDMTAKKTKKKKKKKKSKKKWKKEGEGDKEDGDGRGRLGIPLAEQSRLISYLLVDLTAAPVPPPPPPPQQPKKKQSVGPLCFSPRMTIILLKLIRWTSNNQSTTRWNCVLPSSFGPVVHIGIFLY